MATTRFGYKEDLSLKNRKVGIGTSTANETLEVDGGIRGGGTVVTGIASLTSYEGFQNTKFTNTESTNITGGESGTLSGEVVIGAGLTMSVGTGATTGQGSIKSLKVSNTFTPPIGGTNERPSAPKPGALFYNKDFKTIEYWDGNFWRQVDNITRTGRGLIMGGSGTNAKHLTSIDYISIPTTGNTVSFGDLLQPVDGMSATSSSIRAVTFGGTQNPGSSNTTVNTIQYVTIASSGNSIDFGDLVGTHRYSTSATNGTRSIMFGGSGSPSYKAEIETFNISTLGNAADTGGLAKRTSLSEQVYSPTRAIFVSGYTNVSALYSLGSVDNISKFMHYINITSNGSTMDFGEMYLRSGTGMSNSTRGIIGGGGNPNFPQTGIYYITMASLGRFEEFGDLIEGAAQRGNGNMSTQIRGVFVGGSNPAPARINTMEYVTFSSLGDGVMFGDLTSKCADGASPTSTSATSDSHGGLGGF